MVHQFFRSNRYQSIQYLAQKSLFSPLVLLFSCFSYSFFCSSFVAMTFSISHVPKIRYLHMYSSNFLHSPSVTFSPRSAFFFKKKYYRKNQLMKVKNILDVIPQVWYRQGGMYPLLHIFGGKVVVSQRPISLKYEGNQ